MLRSMHCAGGFVFFETDAEQCANALGIKLGFFGV